MTGPNLPILVGAGVNAEDAGGPNAIGTFQIGVSQIGDIPPFIYWPTIISQYANSPILTQLIANFFQYIDQTANLDSFFDNIWNINTAQGYGLDVWGRIVGVTRTIPVIVGNYFGSEEGTYQPFGQGPFYAGVLTTQNVNLSDAAFRTLIFAKALTNITDGSIPSINKILLALFPFRGNAYVTDGLNMTMAYNFEFALSPVELNIISTTGVLPKSSGVATSIIQNLPSGTVWDPASITSPTVTLSNNNLTITVT